MESSVARSGDRPLLEAAGLEASYGKLKVLRGVSLFARAGEVIAIIGRNGTGKSTSLKAIYGLVRVEAGQVLLDGVDITNRAPADNVRAGIAFVPQTSNLGRAVFAGLSIEENLELGAYSVPDQSLVTARKEHVYDLFPALRAQRRSLKAGLLSGGQQQMLAVGMALMTAPRMLLLDEPTSGLSPAIATRLLRSVRDICDRLNVAVLLVEQNIRQALQVADRLYVVRSGQIVREDIPKNILAAPDLLQVI
ncbi:MAG: ABC transporter ATP-binding protein [Chloroflexi bacterium]|nr:ABC transporter ATP-binding protein [Chloroflexota bacterium]